ncbi:MMPL family transporter [Myxococcota bacterium]|nr:MMPL family transporter [Myxococcota bacterium]MBU1900296.1 MMPL family transporter [Myxococcota bacterium]
MPLIPRLEAGLAWLARLTHRRAGLSLLIAALLCALALLGARRLRLDPDLAHLLPERFESVQDLHALEARAGAIGYAVAVIEGGNQASRRRYGEALAVEIERLDSIRYVDLKRPVSLFEDAALYFLERADLETIYARLKARQRFEARRHNPMYLDLEAATPPSLDFSDIEARYQGGERGWLSQQRAATYYEDAQRLVIMARPARRSTDMGFAATVIEDVEGAIAAAPPPEGLTVALTGRYKKKLDQKAQIQADLGLASSLALLLSLLYLLFHLRRPRAVAFTLAPLLIGLLWTFGLAGALLGTLNLLTGFIGAILLGLGVDHGIHLMSRFEAERAAGRGRDEAITITFASTGRAALIAAVTTAVAFAGLSLSEFRAFGEFGLLAALGLGLVLLAYALLLPAFLAFDRGGAVPQRPAPRRAASRPRAALWITAILSLLALSQAPHLRFDYDFEALSDGRLPAFLLDHEVNRILGYSQTPILALTDSPEEARAITAALRNGDPGGAIDFALTIDDLIPKDGPQKQAILRQIHGVVSRVKPSWLEDPDLLEARTRILRMTQATPPTIDTLPREILRQFEGPDAGASGASGRFVLIFPKIALSDGARVPELAAVARRAAALDARRVPIAGEAMILADILDMVIREAPWILGGALSLVSLALLVLLGHPRDALLALGAALLTLALTLAVAGAAGLALNYLNIVMIPALLGISVDGAVHLITRWRAGEGLEETRHAIAGAILTTLLGFGALTIADHPGLRSTGALAALGLAINALISLISLPALLHFMTPRSPHDDPLHMLDLGPVDAPDAPG